LLAAASWAAAAFSLARKVASVGLEGVLRSMDESALAAALEGVSTAAIVMSVE
jgi:hypothetical protein